MTQKRIKRVVKFEEEIDFWVGHRFCDLLSEVGFDATHDEKTEWEDVDPETKKKVSFTEVTYWSTPAEELMIQLYWKMSEKYLKD